MLQEAFPPNDIRSLGPILKSLLQYFLSFGDLFLSLVFC